MKTVKFLFISFFSISLVVACNNTAKQATPENKIDTAGKEIKIVITQTKINPFKNMSDTTSLQKEIIFIETSFNPIKR